MRVLKCPKTKKITILSDCFGCYHMLQAHKNDIECEIDSENYVTPTYDVTDPKAVEL